MGNLAISGAEQRFPCFSCTLSSINTYMCLFSTCLQLIPKDKERGKFIMWDREFCSPLEDFVWHSYLGLLKENQIQSLFQIMKLSYSVYLSVFVILACNIIMELSLPFGIWKCAYFIWNANILQFTTVSI